ncbi:hypothetical protein [Peribacillus frigoritolerans]|uniref:hypothetical protein n=1 Tax=Peribacillus castrilensis TaxID=2897690 RepID=UPI002DCD9F30|nr:hypothetical protein [Peribacillus castrilensis]
MKKQRNIILYIGTSIDGYIANDDGTLEWLESTDSSKELTLLLWEKELMMSFVDLIGIILIVILKIMYFLNLLVDQMNMLIYC